MLGPGAIAVANPRAFELGAIAISSLALVSVRIVLDAFVLALAPKDPRAFRNYVKEVFARATVFLAALLLALRVVVLQAVAADAPRLVSNLKAGPLAPVAIPEGRVEASKRGSSGLSVFGD